MVRETSLNDQLSADAAYFVAFVSSYAFEGEEFTRESLTEIIKMVDLETENQIILDILANRGAIVEDNNG